MFFLRTTLIMSFAFCILCGFFTIPYGEIKSLAADRNVPNKSLLEKEIKTIHPLLKRIYNAKLKPSTMQSPPDWAVLPHVIHALSIREPQYAISAFNKMPQEVTEAFYCKRTTASLLAQSLEGKYAKEFLLACQRTNNQKIIDAAVMNMRISGPGEIEPIFSLIDPKDVEGSIILLTYAIELKSRGMEWKEIAGRASYKPNIEKDGPAARAAVLMKDYLSGERGSLLKTMSALDFKKDSYAIMQPLAILLNRLPFGRKAGMEFAVALARESHKLPKTQSFFLYGILATCFNGMAPREFVSLIDDPSIREYIAKKLGKTYSIEYMITFFLAKTLIENNRQLGLQLAEELGARILEFENPRSYYHMIGTLCGVIAIKDPEKAMALSNKIRSLEWNVHAKRCIFRAWAKYDAAKAKSKIESIDPEGLIFDKRIRDDLMLEALIGESFADPQNSLIGLNKLPKKPTRFALGICLVAPSLAKRDLSKSIDLLSSEPSRLFLTDSGMALARILLDASKIKSTIGGRLSDFYPDCIIPYDVWPGPRLSPPLRF